MIDIVQLKVGDKVHYQPEHYKGARMYYTSGIVIANQIENRIK